MKVETYSADRHRGVWDEFIRHSRNGTFLFLRSYMDYHADRFEDASLLFWREEQLCAVLPACKKGNTLVSHAGLTYGGLVFGDRTGAPLALECLQHLSTHARMAGFSRLVYKQVPHIYHRYPTEEDRYALFRLGAHCIRVDASTAIRYPQTLPLQERRLRGIQKARRVGLKVEVCQEWEIYWPILAKNLAEKHHTHPVHSLTEMRLLANAHSENIRLFVVSDEAHEIHAGTVIYETPIVAHAQYIASTTSGRQSGALDLLFSWLIYEHYPGKVTWFDFGISTEAEGRFLNEGLIAFKEGFGARTVCYEHFALDLDLPEPPSDINTHED